jgi:hypothetical protein
VFRAILGSPGKLLRFVFCRLTRLTRLDSVHVQGYGTNSIACVQLRPSSADFPKLAVRSKPGNTTVRESEKVLGETVTQRTEEYIDDVTGEKRVRTVEYVEKLIEREV